MNKYLSTAIQAVEAASAVCQSIQNQLVHEDTLIKKDRSPVTIADFASQAMVCRLLKEHFPQIPVVAEEDSAALQGDNNRPLLQKIADFLPGWKQHEIIQSIDYGNGQADGLFWTLDPIDGTKGFLRKDQYAVALALIKDGVIIAGALGCPNLAVADGNTGALLYAAAGEGAFIRSLTGGSATPVRVSGNIPQDEVRFLESVESGHADHDLQQKVVTHFGDRARSVHYDSQVKYAILAQGLADVYLRLPNPKTPDYREKIWDHAAGVAIVTEAGGKISDINGKDLDFSAGNKLINNRGVIVSNGKLHEAIISLLNSKR